MFEQVAAFNQALDREISWKLAKSNFIRFTKDPEMQQIEISQLSFVDFQKRYSIISHSISTQHADVKKLIDKAGYRSLARARGVFDRAYSDT